GHVRNSTHDHCARDIATSRMNIGGDTPCRPFVFSLLNLLNNGCDEIISRYSCAERASDCGGHSRGGACYLEGRRWFAGRIAADEGDLPAYRTRTRDRNYGGTWRRKVVSCRQTRVALSRSPGAR